MLSLTSIVDVLIYCFIELVQLLKVKKSTVMPNFVLNSARMRNRPFFIYKMSDTVHSIVNPLCVFDHLVSDHHILVIENRFRKKLRCHRKFHKLWRRLTRRNYFWQFGRKSRGRSTLIDEEMDTTPSEHFSIYGLISLTFFLSMWVLELEYTF